MMGEVKHGSVVAWMDDRSGRVLEDKPESFGELTSATTS